MATSTSVKATRNLSTLFNAMVRFSRSVLKSTRHRILVKEQALEFALKELSRTVPASVDVSMRLEGLSTQVLQQSKLRDAATASTYVGTAAQPHSR